MKNIISASILIATLFSGAAFASADTLNDPITSENAETMTCSQFLEIDEATIPVTVGYLYALDINDDGIDVIQINDLVHVEVDSIVDECTAAPDTKAMDVIDTQVSQKIQSAEVIESVM